jgi:hypothetical protein
MNAVDLTPHQSFGVVVILTESIRNTVRSMRQEKRGTARRRQYRKDLSSLGVYQQRFLQRATP